MDVGIGTLTGGLSAPERASRIARFNSRDDQLRIFLVVSGAAGTGTELTGASRAFLIDPSLNPATDRQALGRLCRLSAPRDCPVYQYVLVSHDGADELVVAHCIRKGAVVETGHSGELPPVLDLKTRSFCTTAGNLQDELRITCRWPARAGCAPDDHHPRPPPWADSDGDALQPYTTSHPQWPDACKRRALYSSASTTWQLHCGGCALTTWRTRQRLRWRRERKWSSQGYGFV